MTTVLEPTNLLLLACALIYGLIGEPQEAAILLVFVAGISLLHLVIDPACTVVFEALPASPGLMQQPPRPPEAPLFGAATWRRALLQGGVFALLALILACWPGLASVERRSLVFALLLLGGGVLVWLNGEPRHRLTQLGGAIGLGLWLLQQAIPGLPSLLALAPLNHQETGALLLLVLVMALLAVASERKMLWRRSEA